MLLSIFLVFLYLYTASCPDIVWYIFSYVAGMVDIAMYFDTIFCSEFSELPWAMLNRVIRILQTIW